MLDRTRLLLWVFYLLVATSHARMVKEALDYFKMMQKVYKIKHVMDHFARMIDMFVRLGQLNKAFDFMKKNDFEPNEFIWSLLMAGCRSHENLELDFYVAEQLLKLKPKDIETYALVLNMYLSAGRSKDVSRVRKMMKEEKLKKEKKKMIGAGLTSKTRFIRLNQMTHYKL